MSANNPGAACFALMKAIDSFYEQHGVDRKAWPQDWVEKFAAVFQDVVETKMIKTWRGEHGRAQKTFDAFNKSEHEHATEAHTNEQQES